MPAAAICWWDARCHTRQSISTISTAASRTIPKKLFVGSMTVVATVIGIVSGMVTLLPRLDVQSTDRFDPLNPSPIPFTITNSGALSLYNVQFFVGVCKVEWGPRPGATATLRSQNECNGLSEVRFFGPNLAFTGICCWSKICKQIRRLHAASVRQWNEASVRRNLCWRQIQSMETSMAYARNRIQI